MSACADERPELDRAAHVPPELLDLALKDRHSVVLLSSAGGETAVDTAVLDEGRGFVGRALQSGRAAVKPVDGSSGGAWW